jgi:hypothetical protein
MNRRATVATAAVLVVGAAGITPALAASGKAKPKPLKGSWSYTDFTPDPTITVMNSAKSLTPHCNGDVPAGPMDVTKHVIKVAGRGTLTVEGTNTGDWAMEVRDAKGHQLTASDGGLPQDQEGVLLPLTKAGSYSVIFCNLTGAPTASAKYTYVYR